MNSNNFVVYLLRFNLFHIIMFAILGFVSIHYVKSIKNHSWFLNLVNGKRMKVMRAEINPKLPKDVKP